MIVYRGIGIFLHMRLYASTCENQSKNSPVYNQIIVNQESMIHCKGFNPESTCVEHRPTYLEYYIINDA